MERDVLIALTAFFLAAQAYHYVAYPALLCVMSALWPHPVRRGTVCPRVTMITAAHNEAAVIAEKLDNSLASTYGNLQIIAVSDGSTDGTADILRRYAGRGVVPIVLPERRGKAHALNAGIARADGDILVVSDANTHYAPDAIERLVRNFADPSVGLVSGYVTVRGEALAAGTGVAQSEGLYWRYEAAIRRMESAIGSTVSVVGAILAVRRELYPDIPPDVVNDDVFLALHTLRSGHRVVFEPEARCWRRPSTSMGAEVTRRTRMTAGRFQQLLDPRAWPWNQPFAAFALFSHKFLRLLLPFLMLGGLAGNVALLAFPPMPALFAATLAGQCALYALAVTGRMNERRNRRWRPAALAYYIVWGNFSAIGGLLQHAFGRRTVLWQKVDRV